MFEMKGDLLVNLIKRAVGLPTGTSSSCCGAAPTGAGSADSSCCGSGTPSEAGSCCSTGETTNVPQASGSCCDTAGGAGGCCS